MCTGGGRAPSSQIWGRGGAGSCCSSHSGPKPESEPESDPQQPLPPLGMPCSLCSTPYPPLPLTGGKCSQARSTWDSTSVVRPGRGCVSMRCCALGRDQSLSCSDSRWRRGCLGPCQTLPWPLHRRPPRHCGCSHTGLGQAAQLYPPQSRLQHSAPFTAPAPARSLCRAALRQHRLGHCNCSAPAWLASEGMGVYLGSPQLVGGNPGIWGSGAQGISIGEHRWLQRPKKADSQ